MLTVCDGEKIYFLILKTKYKKSEAVKLAFKICGNGFSLTSAAKHDKYNNYLVDRDKGEYWCICKKEQEYGRKKDVHEESDR